MVVIFPKPFENWCFSPDFEFFKQDGHQPMKNGPFYKLDTQNSDSLEYWTSLLFSILMVEPLKYRTEGSGVYVFMHFQSGFWATIWILDHCLVFEWWKYKMLCFTIWIPDTTFRFQMPLEIQTCHLLSITFYYSNSRLFGYSDGYFFVA